MAVPRENLGGAFGSGYMPPTAHPIDIGGAIDAAVGGASTLLKNAYTRRIAETNLAREQAAEQRMEQHAQEQERMARDEAMTHGLTRNSTTGETEYDPLNDVRARIPAIRIEGQRQLEGDKEKNRESLQGLKGRQGQDLEQSRANNRLTRDDVKFSNTTSRDAVLQGYKTQNMNLGASLKKQIDAHRLGLMATNKGVMTPSQELTHRKYVVGKIAEASEGDPDAAEDILTGDGGLAHMAGSLGITPDEVRAAATGVGSRADEATAGRARGLTMPGTVENPTAAAGDMKRAAKRARLRKPMGPPASAAGGAVTPAPAPIKAPVAGAAVPVPDEFGSVPVVTPKKKPDEEDEDFF